MIILDEDTVSEEFHVISNLESWKHLNTQQNPTRFHVHKKYQCRILKGHIQGLNDPIGNILLGGEDVDFSPIVSTSSLHRLFVSERVSADGSEAFFKRLKNLNVMDQLCEEDHVFDMNFGSMHTLLCTRRGRVFGFGNNQFGQLGLGTETYISKPREIVISDENGKQIIFSHIYACQNSSFFLSQNNLLYWCGNGREKVVKKVRNDFSSKIKQIDGTQHIIAIVCENGDFYLSRQSKFGSFDLLAIPYRVIQCALFGDKVVILTSSYEMFSVEKYFKILTRIRLELPIFEHVESVRATNDLCFFLTSNREIYVAKSNLQPNLLIKAPPLPPHFKWFLSTQNSSDYFCVFVKKYSHLKRQNWFFGNLLGLIKQMNGGAAQAHYCDIQVKCGH
nr:unnamed protein product [Naegleria fowleri]